MYSRMEMTNAECNTQPKKSYTMRTCWVSQYINTYTTLEDDVWQIFVSMISLRGKLGTSISRGWLGVNAAIATFAVRSHC